MNKLCILHSILNIVLSQYSEADVEGVDDGNDEEVADCLVDYESEDEEEEEEQEDEEHVGDKDDD